MFVTYDRDLVGEALNVTFTPNYALSASFYQSVSSSVGIAAQIYFYSPEVMLISRAVMCLCYFLLVMGYINMVLGLLSRRLAGL